MHRSLKPPPGVRRHGAGWQARVSVAGAGRSVQQFELATSFETMAEWQEDERYRLRKDARTRNPLAGATPGSFAQDVTTYLAAIAAMPDLARRRKDLYLWVAEFGTRRRATITSTEIRTVRDRWLTVGPKMVYRKKTTDTPAHWEAVTTPLAGSTVNHRLRALSNLYRVLDASADPPKRNPVRAVPEADETPALPRMIPLEKIEALLAALPDRGQGLRHQPRSPVSLTKLRLRVLTWTGLDPAQLIALPRAAVDLDAGTMQTAPRKKGAGAAPVLLPLLPQAIDAFRDYDAAGLWGRAFSTDSVLKSFKRAAQAVGLRPAGVRVKDLRHSFGSRVFLSSGNLRAVGELLQHQDDRTTRRYTLAAVNPVLTAALRPLHPVTPRADTPSVGPIAGPAPPDDTGKQAEISGSARKKTEAVRVKNRRK